jgi:uncharacterized iron-regulated membrane protein
MTQRNRWIWQPQTTWLRKALFQVHLWSGIGIGLYVLVVSLTGSVLVFSNELFKAATRDPTVVVVSGARLTDEQLTSAAERLYPGHAVLKIARDQAPDHAAVISLKGTSGIKNRLFDPYRGTDLGDSVPAGIRLISRLLSLHDDLLGGATGRRINGIGALLVTVLAFTGIIIWWPGIRTWRHNLSVHRNTGWQRFTWDLHSMMGFWSFGFIALFAVSGVYLGNPQPFHDLADRIDAPTPANAGTRTVDQVIYWLAYLHFGRVNGIGIPCRGPGFCDSATKSIWAIFGLAPAGMFITGAVMWWNRVARTRLRRIRRPFFRTFPKRRS